MLDIDEQRKTFFIHASLKLSSMLEERVFDDKTQEDFVDWCEVVYAKNEPYDIAAHVLSEFQRKALEDPFLRRPAYKAKKELLSCDFAESLHTYILGPEKT